MKSKLGQKLRARKSCKNNTPDHSIYNLVLQFLIAVTFSLISSYYSFSFPSLSYYTLKQFLLNPSTISSYMSPKCLFIAMNIIVVFLIAESRLTNSSPPVDIYDEYVERSRNLQKRRTTSIHNDLRRKIVKKVNEEKPEPRVEEKRGEDKIVDEDEGDVEELNRRVENFIARVNKRMRLEAQSVNLHQDMANSIVVHG